MRRRAGIGHSDTDGAAVALARDDRRDLLAALRRAGSGAARLLRDRGSGVRVEVPGADLIGLVARHRDRGRREDARDVDGRECRVQLQHQRDRPGDVRRRHARAADAGVVGQPFGPHCRRVGEEAGIRLVPGRDAVRVARRADARARSRQRGGPAVVGRAGGREARERPALRAGGHADDAAAAVAAERVVGRRGHPGVHAVVPGGEYHRDAEVRDRLGGDADRRGGVVRASAGRAPGVGHDADVVRAVVVGDPVERRERPDDVAPVADAEADEVRTRRDAGVVAVAAEVVGGPGLRDRSVARDRARDVRAVAARRVGVVRLDHVVRDELQVLHDAPREVAVGRVDARVHDGDADAGARRAEAAGRLRRPRAVRADERHALVQVEVDVRSELHLADVRERRDRLDRCGRADDARPRPARVRDDGGRARRGEACLVDGGHRMVEHRDGGDVPAPLDRGLERRVDARLGLRLAAERQRERHGEEERAAERGRVASKHVHTPEMICREDDGRRSTAGQREVNIRATTAPTVPGHRAVRLCTPMTDRLLVEAQRVERAIGRVRWGAAAITLVLGPLFPTLSVLGVYALGAGIVLYNVATLAASRRAGSRQSHAAVARAAFAGDIAALAAAMVLFSADPLWNTYILGPLVITTGAFRFGTGGTLAASLALGTVFTATALLRDRAFGHAFVPERVLFILSVYALTAVLVDRVMRDSRQLRTEREDLIERLERRIAEDTALAVATRVVATVAAPEEVIPRVLQAARAVLLFDRATVFVADEARGEYRVLHRLASGDDEVLPPRAPLGRGLVAAALAEDRPILV